MVDNFFLPPGPGPQSWTWGRLIPASWGPPPLKTLQWERMKEMSSLDSLLRPILIPPTQSLWSALIRVYIDRIESLWGEREEIKIAALDIPAGSHPNTRGWGGGCRLVHRRAHLHVGLSIAFRRLIGQLNQLLISTWSCERAFCQPFLLLPSSVILFRNMAETRADLRCKKKTKKLPFTCARCGRGAGVYFYVDARPV